MPLDEEAEEEAEVPEMLPPPCCFTAGGLRRGMLFLLPVAAVRFLVIAGTDGVMNGLVIDAPPRAAANCEVLLLDVVKWIDEEECW